MSAFNTRGVKSRDMFVRTHVAFYFVSLLLGDILQGGFSVCTRGRGLRGTCDLEAVHASGP